MLSDSLNELKSTLIKQPCRNGTAHKFQKLLPAYMSKNAPSILEYSKI